MMATLGRNMYANLCQKSQISAFVGIISVEFSVDVCVFVRRGPSLLTRLVCRVVLCCVVPGLYWALM